MAIGVGHKEEQRHRGLTGPAEPAGRGEGVRWFFSSFLCLGPFSVPVPGPEPCSPGGHSAEGGGGKRKRTEDRKVERTTRKKRPRAPPHLAPAALGPACPRVRLSVGPCPCPVALRLPQQVRLAPREQGREQRKEASRRPPAHPLCSARRCCCRLSSSGRRCAPRPVRSGRSPVGRCRSPVASLSFVSREVSWLRALAPAVPRGVSDVRGCGRPFCSSGPSASSQPAPRVSGGRAGCPGEGPSGSSPYRSRNRQIANRDVQRSAQIFPPPSGDLPSTVGGSSLHC